MQVRRPLFPCCFAAAALGAPAATSAQVVIVVDDDRVQCPDAAFAQIQPAVDAAAPGDAIRVCPGVYEGTVVVPKPLTLVGSGPDPEQRMGDATAESIVALPVSGPDGFDLLSDRITIDGFTVRMPEDGFVTTALYSGATIRRNLILRSDVGLRLGTSGVLPMTVERNLFRGTITPVRGGLTNGSLSTNAFEANRTPALVSARTATIADNEFRRTPGLRLPSATETEIVRNRFTETPNALEVIRPRATTIASNLVSGGVGFGIRLSGSGATRVEFNIVFGRTGVGFQIDGSRNDVFYRNGAGANALDGFRFTATTGTEIRENGSGSNGGDGFHLSATTSGNLLSLNGARGNLGFDCHDEAVGTGTAGTANTWTTNFGDTSSPPGLCVPPSAG